MKLSQLMSCATPLGDLEITGVTNDSRKIQPGCAFVCIVGSKFDGHTYAVQAIASGAAVVIAQRDTGVVQQVLVEDTHAAYALMCANWFGNPAKKLTLVGVTGTNGKTSVTSMIKAILEADGHKVGLFGTIENKIGNEVLPSKNTTPDAYELHETFAKMWDAGCRYAVMEVSSHALDQKRVYGLEYAVAAFTNLTQDHLDYHGTMENYLQAKKKLFGMCKKAVINFDDACYTDLTDDLFCDIKSYSLNSDEATYTAKNISYRPDGVEFQFTGYSVLQRIKMSTGGKFSVYNGMCAAACALELGCAPAVVSRALAQMQGVKGRAEVVKNDRGFTIIIDYAHTPDGLENILNTFKECEKNRLIALFGCGGDRDKAKRPIMGAIAAKLADFVIVTSDNPRTEDPEAIIDDILVGLQGSKTPSVTIPNRVEAIHYAIQNAKPGDILVLAGKGHETYQILKDKTIHLDEREVIAEALQR